MPVKRVLLLTEPRKVSTPLVSMPGSSHRIPQPLGVVLVIAPWNYPIQLLLIPVAGAIAAGNAVVMKPSEVSSATSALLGKLVPQYFDKDAIAIVEGAVPETTQLLAEKFDHIFYTGNGTVGRVVMRAAAENLTPVTLELGGKSPTIVDKSANLAVAGRRIAWAKYVNAGQTCVAPDYVLAHADIADKLVDEIRKSVDDFYGADPQQSGDFARISSPRHFSRLKAMLTSGKIAIGGQTDEQQRYIAPTVLVDVTANDPVMQEEIFGPVVTIQAFGDEADAVRLANESVYGLAANVWTADHARGMRMAEQLEFGIVWINTWMLRDLRVPFGGMKRSGV
ncbi:MAG: aldehyde dehydrogenase family protein, partial [Planctomycetes bacterium]|nr:aldehyde dehydrogenase family protein [Planctomycetota bacterium]